jgi:hypothetical protein
MADLHEPKHAEVVGEQAIASRCSIEQEFNWRAIGEQAKRNRIIEFVEVFSH